MNYLNQKFKSDANKNIIIRTIDLVCKSKFQIRLNDEFDRIFNDIMDYVFGKFGKKPNDLNDEEHIKNLNKICLDEAINYISNNISYFPKINNAQINNKVQIMNDDRLSSVAKDPTIYPSQIDQSYSQTGLVPYNPSIFQQQSQQMLQQNLFRTTDDLLKQMQYDRGNYGNPNMGLVMGGQYGQDPGRPQPNFTAPTELPGQKSSEQALMEALEQRRKEFPGMNTPNYKPPTTADPNMNSMMMSMMGQMPNSNMGGDPNTSLLMTTLLQTQIAIQNPNLVPAIINEINQMPHLIDMMNKNPQSFQNQIKNPDFLQMIVAQVKNKSNPKMKPMDLNENPQSAMANQPPTTEAPTDEISSEFAKRMNAYKNGDSPNNFFANNGHPNFENLMNKFIPPSDQLVNNTLPDLDEIHLIDYDVCLDFRNDLDLENTAKNRYLLKFHKYGNISKVKLNSCMIPENDYLASEPYIYIKIEELGGRCYTSNHDNVFGKLVLSENRNGYLYYKPDEDSCKQLFSQPQVFNRFNVSFLNYAGKYLNLKEILINKALKLKKQNKLKFLSQYKHKLSKNEEIEIHIYRKSEIDSYTVQVDSILDDYTFTVENVFEVLTDNIKVLKSSINCCLNFKFFEINWHLLTNRTPMNAQLIKLSQLVNEARDKKSESASNGEIVDYVKLKMNPVPVTNNATATNPNNLTNNLPTSANNTLMTQYNPTTQSNPMMEQILKMYMPNGSYPSTQMQNI